MGDRVPEHGCREGRQNEVETTKKKKKKKGEERGVDATLQQRIARALAGFTRSLCLQIVSGGSQERAYQYLNGCRNRGNRENRAKFVSRFVRNFVFLCCIGTYFLLVGSGLMMMSMMMSII
jgi:hypothetical protein